MPVILLWAVPAVFVLGGLTYVLVKERTSPTRVFGPPPPPSTPDRTIPKAACPGGSFFARAFDGL